jgi:hypothetical protein
MGEAEERAARYVIDALDELAARAIVPLVSTCATIVPLRRR